MFNYDKEEVFSICKKVLGNDFDGIFIHYYRLEDALDMPFATNSSFSHFIYPNSYAETNDLESYFISSGVTKLVIIPENTPYVIKIPITGVYNNVDEESTEIENQEFKLVAKSTDETTDIFGEEETILQSFCEEAKLILLQNYYVGSINDVPIYVQEKVESANERLSLFAKPLSNEEKTKMQRVYSNANYSYFDPNEEMYPCTDDFMYDIIKAYGEEMAVRLYEILEDIDDLHSGNYGYTEDGMPKVFDFGGYISDNDYWDWDWQKAS